jgi:hypothetical protein
MKRQNGLVSESIAKDLSVRMSRLGECIDEIFYAVVQAGYGEPIIVAIAALDEIASTQEAKGRLREYWREYARERLSALKGPLDLLRGQFPEVMTYRSKLLDSLREDAVAGRLISNSRFPSPHIEPTLKRWTEIPALDPSAVKENEAVKGARRRAAAAQGLSEDASFRSMSDKERYLLLIQRYSRSLIAAGFKLDSTRRSGLVFRKLTSDKRWAFLMVDQSQEDVGTGSLSVRFGITLPRKAVHPAMLPLSAVATFSPNDICPCFRVAQEFASESLSQFYLAADACTYLTRLVYDRLNPLISGVC